MNSNIFKKAVIIAVILSLALSVTACASAAPKKRTYNVYSKGESSSSQMESSDESKKEEDTVTSEFLEEEIYDPENDEEIIEEPESSETLSSKPTSSAASSKAQPSSAASSKPKTESKKTESKQESKSAESSSKSSKTESKSAASSKTESKSSGSSSASSKAESKSAESASESSKPAESVPVVSQPVESTPEVSEPETQPVDYEQMYNDFINSGTWRTYDNAFDGRDVSVNDCNIENTSIFDLDGNGVPELLLYATAKNMGPQLMSVSAFYTIVDNHIVTLLVGSTCGGTLGGETVSLAEENGTGSLYVGSFGHIGGFGGTGGYTSIYTYSNSTLYLYTNYTATEYQNSSMGTNEYKVNSVNVSREEYFAESDKYKMIYPKDVSSKFN